MNTVTAKVLATYDVMTLGVSEDDANSAKPMAELSLRKAGCHAFQHLVRFDIDENAWLLYSVGYVLDGEPA
jgi:hypothetical protein